MKQYSKILEKELEYSAVRDGDFLGYDYESIEDILYNQIPSDREVRTKLTNVVTGADYVAVCFEIMDNSGRHVYGFSDTAVQDTEYNSDIQKRQAIEHPYVKTVKTAITKAVMAYAGLPKTITEGDAQEEFLAIPDVPEDSSEKELPFVTPDVAPAPVQTKAPVSDKPVVRIPSGKYAGKLCSEIDDRSWWDWATKNISPNNRKWAEVLRYAREHVYVE